MLFLGDIIQEIKIKNSVLRLEQGDITDSQVDAVVNAANSSLLLGAGVAGAIKKKGGSSIQKECNQLKNCRVGRAVITGAGNLYADFVIHAVGPKWSNPAAEALLAGTIVSALSVATNNNLQSLALPAISTGIFGFPTQKASEIILDSIIAYLGEVETTLELVIITLFDEDGYQLFSKELKKQAKGLKK